MNRFYFYLSIVLLLFGSYAQAEEMDKTDLIKNAGLESIQSTLIKSTDNGGIWQPEGWTVDYKTEVSDVWDQAVISSGKNGKNEDLGFTATEGNQFFYSRMRWVAGSISLNQTLKELPKGAYTLSCMAIAPEGTSYPTTLFVTTPLKELSTPIICEDWQQFTINFDVLGEKEDIVIGAMMEHIDAGNQGRIFLDDFRLTYNGVPDEDAAISEMQGSLNDLISSAKIEFSSAFDMPISIWNQLQDAINKASNIVTSEDVTVLNQSILDLKAAISLAQQGVETLLKLTNTLENAYYDMDEHTDYSGLAAFEEAINKAQDLIEDENADIPAFEKAVADLGVATRAFYLSGFEKADINNPTDATWLITNPDFEEGTKGWEGTWVTQTTGNNYEGFNGTFLEKWTGSPQTLGDFRFSQTLTDLPNGLYVLSAQMISTLQSDASVQVKGTYLFGNGAATEAATENGVPQLYSTEIIVTDHTLTIGAETRSTMANWVAIDNMTLAYVGVNATSFKENLNKQIEIAENLLTTDAEKIMGIEKAAANSAIAISKSANSVEEISSAYTELSVAIDKIRNSITAYNNLYPTLVLAEELSQSTDYEEADMTVYRNTLTEQKTLLTDESTQASDLTEITENLSKAIQTLKITVLKPATLNNGVDATWLITNPGFDGNSSNGWNSPVNAPTASQNEIEFFQKTCDFHQILKDIPCGIYELSVQGFQRTAANDSAKAYNAGTEIITAYLYANSDSIQLKSLYGESQETLTGISGLLNGYPNGMAGAQEAFTQGLYKRAKVNTGVSDHTLTIGIRNPQYNTGGWICFDSFILTYFGNEGGLDIKDINNSSSTLQVSIENGYIKVAGVETFTLTTAAGIPISPESQLIPGVYFVRANGQSLKIMVP